MYVVEIRSNQSWQIRSKKLEPRKWTCVSKADFKTQKLAEMEVAYLTLDFEDVGHLLRNFKIDYRIRKDGSTLWEREEIYNQRK